MNNPQQMNAMSPRQGAERRTAPRVALRVRVGLRSETNFYTGFTCDLSTGGLFVATHRLQPIGTVLALAFTLPTGSEIEALGVVRWVRDLHNDETEVLPGMGIQFQDLDEEEERTIREFMAIREPMFYA